MHDPIPLERVAGVDVRMDWSWLVLVTAFFVALVATTLGTRPDWALGTVVGIAALATLGLVASLLARDALQALAARRLGAPMTGVTLFLAGSAPTYAARRRSAVREAVVATVGPLFHASVGVFMLTIAGLVAMPVAKMFLDPTGVLRTLPPGATAFAWIGIASLLVAALDALPAYPLAGGRVLRSVLWETTRDYRLATNVAVRLGQAIAVLFLLVGLSSAFGLGPRTSLEGVFLILVGWSLLHASTVATHHAALDDRLAGVPVSQLMRPIVRMIAADATLADAAVQHFVGASSRALPVMKGDACVGVLRFEDLRKAPPREWFDRPVHEVMVPLSRIPRIGPHTDLARALRALATGDSQVAPVIDRGEVVGAIETGDIVRWLEAAELQPAGAPEPEESMRWSDLFRTPRTAA